MTTPRLGQTVLIGQFKARALFDFFHQHARRRLFGGGERARTG